MFDSIKNSFVKLYDQVLLFLGEHFVDFLLAFVVALVGWGVAEAAKRITHIIVSRLQGSLNRLKWLNTRVEQLSAYNAAPRITSLFAFWVVLFLFLAASVQTLGLSVLAEAFGSITAYLPRVLISLIIILVGVLFADVVSAAIAQALSRIGKDYSDTLSRIARLLVISVAIIIAIEQVGINGTVLTLSVSILFGSTLGAVALAFGLGAREPVSNLLAMQQIVKDFSEGDLVSLEDTAPGRIVKFSKSAVIIERNSERIYIPGSRFNSAIIHKKKAD